MNLFTVGSFSAATAQPQVGGRRQIDDMEANNARTHATASPKTVSNGATTNNVTDELGSLPPGWQMSKTDSGRPFFIDHINKRTSWVKHNKIFVDHLIAFFVKVDPRTGKPSPQPHAQRELNQNGPLPVSKRIREKTIDNSINFFYRTIGKFVHCRMVVCIISIIVRTNVFC
jgi:hypothetical protein